jgi:hypothetical protein
MQLPSNARTKQSTRAVSSVQTHRLPEQGAKQVLPCAVHPWAFSYFRKHSNKSNESGYKWAIWLQNRAKALVWALAGASLLALSGCATQVWYGFDWDAYADQWISEVTLLDLKYHDGRGHNWKGNPYNVPNWKVRMQSGATGTYPLGDSLWVKYRINATGQVKEETADLRGKYPSDLHGGTVRFMLKNGYLAVYTYVSPRDVRSPQAAVPPFPDFYWSVRYKTCRIHPGPTECR